MRRLFWAAFGRLGAHQLALVGLVVALAAPTFLFAKEAQWLWSPAFEKEMAPEGVCYFRKTFNLNTVEHGQILIGCDDSYELWVNGRQVGAGNNWKQLDDYDITRFLAPGQNTVAVKAVNSEGSSAGLVARVLVKAQGNTHVDHSSDGSWKTTLKEFPGWQKPRFNDSQWLQSRAFGALGATLPWGNEVSLVGSNGRYKVTPEFHVEWVVEPKDTGSLICMTFDEFGQIIAARENGGLVIIRDSDRDGLVDTVSPYCDTIKNCQGLLALSGKLYAVGEGPEGAAMYRLSDEDQDGQVDRMEAILKFTGEIGEHGPHALTLGPDGLLYILVGNFAHVAAEVEPSSPYHDYYEGDLILPRYEDAGGHAVGIQAPAGTILRTDTAGSAVELFAGGLQNPYDLVFNAQGDLFTCDSDMEWDMGMPWYRPTRLNHVAAGAEFGWRSGWAKWPNYFVDSLPPVLELGRGSPAGMEVYNHYMFPQRYHNALFVCDWSRGRILAIRPRQNGAGYKAMVEVFLEGQPLNATDVAVGPDGGLYFCTGGRDTEGGVYRVVWDGKVPPQMIKRGKGILAALEQPQLNSAWARQRVALVRQQLGDEWEPQLARVLADPQAPVEFRVRALELLQLFGPDPDGELLVDASRDKAAPLRAKTAYLMGLHVDGATQARLIELLDDRDLSVARTAADSLARVGQLLPAEKLVRMLSSPDRSLSWAAGRALQRIPRAAWEEDVVKNSDAKGFVNGSTALLTVPGLPKRSIDGVLTRSGALLRGYLSDPDFLDLLRVMQLAMIKGQVDPETVIGLRTQLADEYPARDPLLNRELVRLLVYLQEPTFATRLVEQVRSDIPSVERMQLLSHARFLNAGWNSKLKLAVLEEFESSRTLEGGHSFAGYIENLSRDFFATFNEQERQMVLADGAKWPTSALSVLAKLPPNPSQPILAQIEKLDQQVKRQDSEAAKRLRIGICAVLGASGDAQAMAYLRELFEAEPDRRVTIAIALAQQPDGKNWPLLVRSLSIVEGTAAQEVLAKLTTVNRTPEEPEAFRQVILRGLLLRENGGKAAVTLLEKWTGQQVTEADASWQDALVAWQGWFTDKYPDLPEPRLPVEKEQNHWTYQELLSVLTGTQAVHGSAAKGQAIFEKAQCVKCHRYADRGDLVGPDLTNVSKRFQKKEILESILYPSQTISDQYATQTITTVDGRTVQGMVAPRGDGSLVVLQANGDKTILPQKQIEHTARTKVSAMPEGLLNGLTLEEVADLFAYITGAKPEVATQPPRGPLKR